MLDKIDIGLIADCLSKNGGAQKKLYHILLPYLNIICKRYLNQDADLKDALQDSFINIFKNLDQFDLRKSSFKTWATKITINNCLKYNHKYKKAKTEELIPDLHDLKIDPAFLEKVSNEDLIIWLKKMPQPYFEVFNMFVIDGFSHKEIASLLRIDASLSRKRLSRAREWIKKRTARGNKHQFNFSFN